MYYADAVAERKRKPRRKSPVADDSENNGHTCTGKTLTEDCNWHRITPGKSRLESPGVGHIRLYISNKRHDSVA